MSDPLTTGAERLEKRFNQIHLYAADIASDPGVKALVEHVQTEDCECAPRVGYVCNRCATLKLWEHGNG